MSKYGRLVKHGDEHRLVDVIDIPATMPDWAEDADAFCRKLFPDFDMVPVPDDAVSGAVDKGNGTYKAPPVVIVQAPIPTQKDELVAKAQAVLDSIMHIQV